MNEERIQELKKYINPKNWKLYLFGGMFMVGFLFVLSLMLTGAGESAHLIVLAVFLVAGVGFIWGGISGQKAYKKHMAQLEESGELSRVLSDFAGAQTLVDGKIRVGQSYLFGKGQGQIVPYGDIRQVYQYIHKRNFVEDGRQLRYVNQQGKTFTLCDLKLKGKSDEDVLRIITAILAKNPGVQVGYK